MRDMKGDTPTLDEFAVSRYGLRFHELCQARQEVAKQVYFVNFVRRQ